MSGRLVERLIELLPRAGTVVDVRVGALWTAVVIADGGRRSVGMAATQLVHDLPHGQPAVREAGRLIGRSGVDLARLVLSGTPTEHSIGMAAINALLPVDTSDCVDINAEELIIQRGAGRRVAIVGHFPFVPRVRESAARCDVLELNPVEGDLQADEAPRVIPEADVVAVTGMTVENGTFETLSGLFSPKAFVVVLGATTPLSPLLFGYGVSAISGTIVTDIDAALAGVSQGANFRQIPGKRLVTMLRPGS